MDNAALAEEIDRVLAATVVIPNPEAPSRDDSKELSASAREAIEDLEPVKDALRGNEKAQAAISEAVSFELRREAPGDRASFKSISVDTSSPRLEAEERARVENQRLETQWVAR